MKLILIAMLFSISASAQNSSSRTVLARGPQNVNFEVKQDDTQHTVVQPEPGKARVYFIQDKGVESFGIGGAVISMIGLDGVWVGGNKDDSYFSVPIEPGEHHVCANVQSHLGHPMELLHFIAEAGKIYYFRERIVPTPYGVYLFFDPVDSDEAKYLMESYPLSVSRPKK
jgi:hypothetical protein